MKALLNQANEALRPPRKIKPSDWVEEHLYFPDGVAGGQKMKLFEFQKEPIDQCINPEVRKIVAVSSAQLLKTTVGMSIAQYLLVNRPANTIIGMGALDLLRKFRKGKWENSINYSPIMQSIMSSKSDKNSTNSEVQQKLKDGTDIFFTNLNAPSGSRSVYAKYLILDEVAPLKADDREGDPIALISERSKTDNASLMVITSTPLEPDDTIMKQWAISDQRKFHVPCPHCETFHELVWENVRFKFKEVEGSRGRAKADPETAELHCPHCDGIINEIQRAKMITLGKWVPTRPEIKDVVRISYK